MNLNEFEARLGYKFKDIETLKKALTHSSFANEHKVNSYERLEFLGDSLLGFICAQFLCKKFPNIPEGELTKIRSSLVCEKSLCNFSRDLGVGKYMFLSNGESRTGGRNRPSILADMFESIIAAMYIDGADIEHVRKFVIDFLEPATEDMHKQKFKDYKTMLQEIIQKNPEEKLSYIVVSQTGPDHNKHFQIEVRLNSNCIGKGGGKSKKEAEQQAARIALELMGY